MSTLFGENAFQKAFQEFDENEFFYSLHNRIKNKSYFEKYKGFKATLLFLSYLFNIASALTASYAVYWLTKKLTGFEIPSWIVAIAFLFFLEKIKRKSSSEFWQVLFFNRQVAAGWLALSLFCLGISLASSAFGVKEGTEDMGPGAELIATDSTAQDYRNQISKLEADNLKLEKQRNHKGEIYWPAQKEKEKNKAMITDLTTRVLELDKRLEGHNEKLSISYREDIAFTAWTLVWITIAMEILFELCIAWIWYYYYRSYVERRQLGILPAENYHSPSPTPQQNHVSQSGMIDQNLISQVVAATLQNLQTSTQQASPPPPSSNGHNEDATNKPQNSLPIGFFSDAQRELQMRSAYSHTEEALKTSVQACTDVYRSETKLEDLHTVVHEYTRGGKTYRTPYTENQILSRIGQYERELEDAKAKGMDMQTINNRNRWLTYWKGKLKELKSKQASI
jgi:hypothetical protein